MTADEMEKLHAELATVNGEFAKLALRFQRQTRDLQRPGIRPEDRDRIVKDLALTWQQGSALIDRARETLKKLGIVPQ